MAPKDIYAVCVGQASNSAEHIGVCGIAGVLSKRLVSAPSLAFLLGRMTHRGPDGEGQWSGELSGGGSVWLGHRRLSILDLSDAASQPMWDRDGAVALVFNGEIYNYLELRSELIARGGTFQTTSDSEVLLQAYKVWGESCLDRLNGMFGFAIWDTRKSRLFAARDRYGEKPFLFVAKPGFFAFASEFKALLSLPQVDTGYSEMEVLKFACDEGRDSGRMTVFADVMQLQPGEALSLEATDLIPQVRRWYQVRRREAPRNVSEADIFAEFRSILIDSVKIRMRSDVPVGSCLSGGLDSSAIVCVARQLLGPDARYNTFTGIFPGTYADEAAYADLIVSAANTTAHTTKPTALRFIEEAPDFMWMNELPVGSASQFAQWCVFHRAKQEGVTVLLDGQGADEILGGYEQYFAYYLKSLRLTRQEDRLARELPLIRERYPLALAPPVRNLRDSLPFRLRHFLASTLGTGSSLLFNLKLEAAEQIRRDAVRADVPGRDALASALEQDSFGRFLTTLLRYGDRNSMAHSREVRLPFCDHRIAEFVLGLPPEILMGNGQTKRVLRESLRGILPEAIRTRWNKQGFRPPQDLWFAEPRFLSFVQDTLASQHVRNSPYYQPRAWDRLLRRIKQGEVALGWKIWLPFIIELWREHFVLRVRADKAAMNAAG